MESEDSTVGLKMTSKRTYAMVCLPGLLLPMPLFPWWATVNHASEETLRHLQVGLSQSPFPWVLVHTKFCLCPPRAESLFPLVPRSSCNQIPLTLKVRFSGDLQSLGQNPSLGVGRGWNLDNGARTSSVLLFSNLWVTHWWV